MSERIDLHVHTTASDGTLTPAEAVSHACELGLRAIAVTDHDTVDGLAEAEAAAGAQGLELIRGVELSVDWRGYGVHILGYFVDPASPELLDLLEWVVVERLVRNEVIAAAMRADGIPVDIEDMEARWPGAVLGRPHFAQMLAEHGLCEDVNDGFRRYLSNGQRYYRPRRYIPMKMAFGALHACRAKPVFAHPFQYRLPEEGLLSLTQDLCNAGIVGMECLYAVYDAEQSAYLQRLAAHFGLCVTGGSDFHGASKPNRMGTPEVPYALLERLREK